MGASVPRPAQLGIALLLVTIIGLVGGQATMLDRYFIFFPESELIGTPTDVAIDYEEILFTASDGVQLHGWYVPAQSDTTLIWFHGNAGNISHRLANLLLLHHELGVNLFIFDYRGYGRSNGSPSEEGLYMDAEAARNYILSRPTGQNNRVIFFGRSLGTAVAVELATRHEVTAIILESPFTSIRAMATQAYPFIPAKLLVLPLQSRFDSLSKIGLVNSPVMILHGDMDNIVPYEGGKKLYDAAKSPKRFFTIAGASHDDTIQVGGKPYFEALKAFIENPRDE